MEDDARDGIEFRRRVEYKGSRDGEGEHGASVGITICSGAYVKWEIGEMVGGKERGRWRDSAEGRIPQVHKVGKKSGDSGAWESVGWDEEDGRQGGRRGDAGGRMVE